MYKKNLNRKQQSFVRTDPNVYVCTVHITVYNNMTQNSSHNLSDHLPDSHCCSDVI